MWLLVAGCDTPASDDRVCARIGAHTIFESDLTSLRAHLRPAPPKSQSLALALDVRTAEFQATGAVGVLDWPEAIREYRRQVREARELAGVAALEASFSRVQARLGVEPGTCTVE